LWNGICQLQETGDKNSFSPLLCTGILKLQRMKKLIYLIGIVVTSSCNVMYFMPNAADDVYYSRKANREKPVLIPKVDVDSILQANPPRYGAPTNRINDDNSTANPMAEVHYPQYKAYWDSMYQAQPWLSGYYTSTTPPPFDERETQREARRIRRLERWNNSNWNWGVGITPGWGWNNGFGWGLNSGFGWNNGLGWNRNRWGGWNSWWGPSWQWGGPWQSSMWLGWGDPWLGWGPGFYDPWWGWGPGWWNNPVPAPNGRDESRPSQQRPRQENTGGGSSFNPSTAASGQMRTIPDANTNTAPSTPMNEQQRMRPASSSTPRLVDVNGRQVYVPATSDANRLRGYETYQSSNDAAVQQQQMMPSPTPETKTAPVQRMDNTMRMRANQPDNRNTFPSGSGAAPAGRSTFGSPASSGGMRPSGGGGSSGGAQRPRR
jgi:hypothetical protein